METTSLAALPSAALNPEQWLARTRKALELFRVDATIKELRDTSRPNERLIAWYEGRRELLSRELGL